MNFLQKRRNEEIITRIKADCFSENCNLEFIRFSNHNVIKNFSMFLL